MQTALYDYVNNQSVLHEELSFSACTHTSWMMCSPCHRDSALHDDDVHVDIVLSPLSYCVQTPVLYAHVLSL